MKRNSQNYGHLEIAAFLDEQQKQVASFDDLADSITKLAQQTDRKLVLLIDEVDKSSNNQPFVSFLAMLRDKYLHRDDPGAQTFHSIVLVGVHDVKTLKVKLRPGEQATFNSPWNIAADFKVDMRFLPRRDRTDAGRLYGRTRRDDGCAGHRRTAFLLHLRLPIFGEQTL